MIKSNLFTVVPAALAISVAVSTVNLAQVPRLQITTTLPSDPLILKGISGGEIKSDCGNIPKTPSQIIKVIEPLPYLRVTATSAGQPTLLINGPGGRFCLMADNYTGTPPQLSGYWQGGEYSLYVGELSENQYNYTLSISQQKEPIR